MLTSTAHDHGVQLRKSEKARLASEQQVTHLTESARSLESAKNKLEQEVTALTVQLMLG